MCLRRGGGSPSNSKAKWNLDESVHLYLQVIHSLVQIPPCYSHKGPEERGCEEAKERKAPIFFFVIMNFMKCIHISALM